MLMDFPVPENKKSELAGAIHADGTARFQTIYDKKDNPFMYDLLEYMDKTYRIKALINTSFNAHEEPMVHTVKDALTTAKKLKITCVVINGEINYIPEY